MRDWLSLRTSRQTLLAALAIVGTVSTALATSDTRLRDLVTALSTASERNPIDLRGQDLSDLDLSNLDFKAARLDAANLFGVNLSKSDMRNVSLAGVVLDRAQLTNTDFTKADLSGSRILIPAIHLALESHIWNAPSFRQTKLKGAWLSGNFDGSDFGAANLEDAEFGVRSSLERCEFSGANLKRASFHRARLTYARFLQADLRGADLRDAQLIWVDFTDADLRDADLRGADLSMAILNGAKLDGAKIGQVTGLSSARGLDRRQLARTIR